MKNYKLIVTLIIIAAQTVFLTGCMDNVEEILYQTDSPDPENGITKIYYTEKLDPPSAQEYTFQETSKTKEDVENEVRAVVTVKIKRSDELAIDYIYEQISETRYISYLIAEVTDVFSDTNSELQKGSEIKIFYSNNTHVYIDSLPLIQEGEEYFMFLTTMISPFHEYGKYYIYMPQTLLFKKNENGFYDFTKMLEVFTLEDFGLTEGAVPTIDIMHDFFSGENK